MKKEVIIIFMFCIWFLFLISNAGFVKSNEIRISDYALGEINVKYSENVVSAEGNEIIVKKGKRSYEKLVYENVEKPVEVEKIAPDIELYNLKFDSNRFKNVEEIIKEYEMLKEVEYAEPNYILTFFEDDYRGFVVPNDTSYSSKWDLININAERAWNLTIGNKNVVIAIIDTGVDWNHPDLSLNIWNNSDENCSEVSDLDGNSYNGDCRGYDFVDINTTSYVESGYTLDNNEDYNISDNNPMDYQGHGTHVAGIASAVGNNGIGIPGACWNCSIMPVRAGFKIQPPNQSWVGSLETDDVVSAIYYASNNNATVISMSFGGSHSSSMDSAINASYANGSILVASSGNSGANSTIYPCSYDKVICVSATDSDNTSASYSNYGSWVDLSAPGTGILSTYYDDTYISLSGTSMATPLVAGAIGLIKSLFNKNQTEVKNALNSTGSAVDFSGISIPRINIYSALLSFDVTSPNVNLISPTNGHVNLSVNQTFICNMSDWQLKNVTLQIWNSSNSLYYNFSQNISGIFNQIIFNISNLVYDSYKWNCLVYDERNNFAYASSNFSLILENVSVSLISPSNGTNSRISLTEFNCSSQTENTKELRNITFSIWNSSLSLVYNLTINISGISNSSSFNYSFSNEGNYFWNCKVYNNLSENVIAVNNFTFVYDITIPSVNLLDPLDSAGYTSNSQSIIFGFNISDSNNIANCSLIINNAVSLTNNSVDKNLVQNFSSSFSPGIYSWNINCSDSAGNTGNSSARSFVVNTPSSSSSSSSSSGGSGSGASISSVPIPNTYIISKEQGSSGYTKELGKNDKIKFTFFDAKQQEHSLTVDEVGDNYVKIIIQSNPINLKLGIGQSAKLNLTNPDYYDFFVKLNYINNKKAEITIQLINEKISKQEASATGKAVESTEDKSKENNIMETLSLKGEIKELKNIVYMLVIILILVVIFILFKERKYIRERIAEISLLEHKEKFDKEVKPKGGVKRLYL